jgi:hypothetical protein
VSQNSMLEVQKYAGSGSKKAPFQFKSVGLWPVYPFKQAGRRVSPSHVEGSVFRSIQAFN